MPPAILGKPLGGVHKAFWDITKAFLKSRNQTERQQNILKSFHLLMQSN